MVIDLQSCCSRRLWVMHLCSCQMHACSVLSAWPINAAVLLLGTLLSCCMQDTDESHHSFGSDSGGANMAAYLEHCFAK